MTIERFRPRKSWGQHFLTDPQIQRKILDAAQIVPGETVVEIGPGRGLLTHGLLARGARVSAIEIDPILAAAFHPPPPGLQVIRADAMRYPFETIEGRYKIVANLPYNISTPLLFRLLDVRASIPLMVLMLQKEVAARLLATGGADYGALSVLVQCWADVEKVCAVSPGCFRPRPNVDSTVIRIVPQSVPRIGMADPSHFARVVKAAFAHRRKRLSNSLIDAGFKKEDVAAAATRLCWNPTRRAEVLSLSEFAQLADALPTAVDAAGAGGTRCT